MRYTTRIIVPPKVRRSGQPGTGGAYRPQVLGVRKSFGFDDPFGLAAPGHLGAAFRHPEFAPVFAQHTYADALPGERSATDGITTAIKAVSGARFRQPWGADANLLKGAHEVEDAAAAGYTYYTFDPSDLIRHEANGFSPEQIAASLRMLVDEGELPEDWSQHYVERTIDLPGSRRLVLALEPLERAAVKYTRAIRYCARLSEAAARANQGRPYEMEAFFAASQSLASPLEHLFIGLELEARGVRLTGLALRLVEPADASDQESTAAPSLEARLREHAAVAEFCGPYKLSFHNVSQLPSVFPVIGRCCAEAFHIKSGNLSYLEALRVVLLTNPGLFEIVAQFAKVGADTLAASLDESANSSQGGDLRGKNFLAESARRLSAAYGGDGQSVRSAVVATLERHADIYHEQLTALFDKRLSLLKAG